MNTESHIKAYILTHGVEFTDRAMTYASKTNAKGQNLVYNAPVEYSENNKVISGLKRPQELLIEGLDGYIVCSSAVSPVKNRKNAIVDVVNNDLVITTPSIPKLTNGIKSISFVSEPEYYSKKTSTGRDIKRIVSSCGVNELNIWPWHDCAVKGKCSFCGINTIKKNINDSGDLLHALEIRELDADKLWDENKQEIVDEIIEAVNIAKEDKCFTEGIHLIIISGNLDNKQLNTQATLYSDIAKGIDEKFGNIFKEGIVVVTAPPNDLTFLKTMKESGVQIGVFNLEAYSEQAFNKHCKGKTEIGRDHFIDTLKEGVRVFGWGKSWTNFVLGLEDHNVLLDGCSRLASSGINPSANVLHIDYGSNLDIEPPTYEVVIDFFKRLDSILKKNNLQPYYSEIALRTSLSNEAYANRL
jgi:hypothetical protein